MLIARAPGRINIIGEHTDYNLGYVLPAAIDKAISMKLSRNGSASTANFVAKNVSENYSCDLNALNPVSNGWENYVMGVVSELQKLGAQLSGFDAEFEGDVPIGSGMSSSAALECSLAYGLNELFGLGLNKWQLIKASQMAEHNMVGIRCGIMDQFASVMGKKDHVMLLDCRSLEFDYFPFDLGDYEVLLLNTNVSHSLASSEFNTRRSTCEEGVSLLKKQIPDIESLRDISVEQLFSAKKHLPKQVFDRCRHVVEENVRVIEATKALQQKDYKNLGKLMFASHDSLNKLYDVSCPELNFLVELAKQNPSVLGSRLMGGGFGGCTINLLHKDAIRSFVAQCSESYRRVFQKELSPYEVSVENGAGVLSFF